ncbi:MAG: DNA-binding SARP family transcriptional activator/tetratricopeptide (TPR) repeat protein [Ascidiaceihabitans sp.]|jgi:DNA-binding SARP family transcriptional activator/tetratricopeptide (TPR) repeat protein
MGILIKLLGGPAFCRSDGSALHLPTRKSEALFAYLLERGGEPVSREALSAHLWPYSGEEQARASLRQEVSVLRKALGPDFADVIVTLGDRLSVRHEVVDVDIWTLRAHRRLGHDPAALLALFERYTAPFLDTLRIRSQPFTDWVWATQQSLQAEIMSLGQTALLRCNDTHDYDTATQIAKHLCRIEPTYEPAHQALIRAYLRSGDMAAAQRQLRTCQAALADQLDAKVQPETLALFDVSHIEAFAPAVIETNQAIQQRRYVSILSVMTNLNIADPEDFDHAAQAVSAQICDCVEAKGGLVLRASSGDVVACFGYPAGHDKDPDTATFTALDILKTLVTKVGGAPKAQIGLAYGQVLISTDDTGNPKMSGAVLRTANSVALQSPFGAISMCRDMAAVVSPAIRLTPQRGADTFRQLAQKPDPTSPSRPEIILDHQYPILGREDQLADMSGLLKQAKRGSGSVAAILGNPGEGKSRLVHEITQEAQDLGFEVQVFHGRRSEQQTVFAPVLAQLLSLGGFASHYPSFAEIEGWLTRRSTDLTPTTPYFDALITSSEPSKSQEASFSNDARQAALNIFAAHAAQAPPTVMVFEDVQWFDPTTCAAIARLIDAVPDARVLAVLVSRLGEEPKVVDHPFVQKIILAPLNANKAEQLLRGLLGKTSAGASTIKNIIERAEGNPLILEEFAKAIIDQPDDETSQAITFTPTFSRGKTDATVEAPSRLLPLLLSRIDAVPGALQTLQYACVFGRRFTSSNLKEVLKPARASKQLMAELVGAGILFATHKTSDTSYIFKHALIGEAIYSTIPKGERPTMHTAAAEALLTGEDHLNFSEIARHFRGASKPLQASQYFERSGDVATVMSAHSESISEYQEALNMVVQLPHDTARLRSELKLNVKIASQFIALRGIPTAEVTPYYAKALAIGETLDDADEQLNAVRIGWSIHLMVADLDQCLATLAKLAPVVKKLDTPISFLIQQYMLGVTQAYRGDLQAAAAHLGAVNKTYQDEMKEELQTRFSMDIILASNSFLGWVYALRGQRDNADAATQRALQVAQKNKNGLSLVFANVFAATKCLFLNDIDAARTHAEQAKAGADEMGFAQWSAQARMQLARIADLSDDPEALQSLEHAKQDYMSSGMVLARPYVDVWIAEAQIRRGQHQAAIATLDALEEYTVKSAEKYYNFALVKARNEALSGKAGALAGS